MKRDAPSVTSSPRSIRRCDSLPLTSLSSVLSRMVAMLCLGRVWVLALWLMTLRWINVQGVIQVTSCLQTVEQIPINCPNDKMIHVTLAFLGRTKDKQYEEFCSGPYSSSDDCRSSDATMTANVGIKCSTFTSCRYDVPTTESIQCEDSFTGYLYMHIEYECLSRNYPDTSQTIPWGGMLDEDSVDGTMVYLASNGYNQWNTASVSSCRISVPQESTLSVTIYDFLSNTSNSDCSARLLVTNDKTTTVCAQAPWTQEVINYDATHSRQTVDFLMQQTYSTVVSKLLILLQATDNLLVKCGAHVVTLPPTTTPSTTTTSTTTVSLPVNVPGTDTSSSTPKTTRSNHVTTLEPSVKKSTGKKIADFLEDNIIAFATAAGVLLLLILVIIIMCVVTRKRSKPKPDEQDVIDGWQWQSNTPDPGLSHAPSKASTLNKSAIIDPYSTSSGNATDVKTKWSATVDRTSRRPDSPPDLYAVPTKKKKPEEDTYMQPVYSNVDDVGNVVDVPGDNNPELVYGYTTEIAF